jgi:hypothetical protein
MTTFNAGKTLSKTKPETILKWAIKKLRANCKTAQANEVEYESKLNDENFKRILGKRELKKLETGKATLAELRKAKLDSELATYTEETEKAIQNLTAAFAKELPAVIDISVDWKRHRVWGYNPKAEVWANGYTASDYVGGCGYDKESTATAEAFKQNNVFARIVATCAWLDMKETKATGKPTHTYGYTDGYDGFRFEGAVGFRCHQTIIERAGYSTAAEFHPKSSDCYKFEKK